MEREKNNCEVNRVHVGDLNSIWFQFLLSHPGQLLASLQQGALVLRSSLSCGRQSMKRFWQRAQAGK